MSLAPAASASTQAPTGNVEFSFEPDLDTPPAPRPIVQHIVMRQHGVIIGKAIWFASGLDGCVQLLHLHIDASLGRRGLGTLLFKQVLAQARAYFARDGQRLRRVTAHAEQKTQVVGRAWLTRNGFHHTETITNLLRKQDVLVYTLGCD